MVAAAIVLPYLFHRINEEIRVRVESRFARHYPDLKVTIRSAELVEGVGIEIRGMSFSEREEIATNGGAARDDRPSAPFVYLEHVILSCPTELSKLLLPDVPISKITVHRPTFRISRRLDGSWNMAKLWPLPCFGSCKPEVIVEGGAVEIIDERKNPTSMYTLRDLNLRLATPEPADGYSAENSSQLRSISGTMTGGHLRRVEFTGELDPETASWNIGGMVEGLELSPELCVSLPSLATERLMKVLGTFRGRGQFGFRLKNGNTDDVPVIFQLSGDIDEGRLDDRRLPAPLMNISATVCCNNEGFSIKDMFARSGQTTFRLSGKMAGYAENSPWEIDAEINNLDLEPSLMGCLPEKLQKQWAKYSPSGAVKNLKLKLQSDADGFRPDLAEISAQCADVAFSYEKFPYELEHSHGSIDVRKNVLTASLTGYSSGQAVEVKAQVFNPISMSPDPPPAAGWSEIRAACVPLDAKLFTAIGKMDSRTRAMLDLLAPQGSVGFYGIIRRNEAGDEPQKSFVIGLNGCSINYKKFPYPIRDIRGTIERFADGSWSLRDIEGRNDTGRITCKGTLDNTSDGKLLSLVLTGTDIPLEKELRDALPPNMQRFWDDTKPRGIINLDEIKIDWLAEAKKLSIKVVGRPMGDTVSIEPKAFPYRMESVEGRMIYSDGHVTLERFKARHGSTQMSSTGYCKFFEDGGWNFHLDGVNVDRLRMDRELMLALPARLRMGVTELSPDGPMYLRDGSLDLVRSGRPDDPIRAGWYAVVGFHQCNIDCGVKLHNMHGNLTVAGQFNGEEYFSQGELAIDSLMYNDIQFTQVMGPFWIDNDNIWLGYAKESGDANAAERLSRVITAKVFGGTLEGDCIIDLNAARHYSLRARLTAADLSKCAKETMAGQQKLQGKIFANINLRGAGKSLNTLKGRGEIKLREANVYELPMMISLLKLLSIREPDTNAFSESDIRFSIGGNHIYFNPINFTGDAISLRGRGEMDFNSKVNLNFYTVVGRDKMYVPIISPVLGGASQQVLVINVTGPLNNPRMTQEIFPNAKKALQQLQADLRGTAASANPAYGNPTPALFPNARPWTLPSAKK